MGPIRVLVVDDHSLVRAGFRSILSDEDGIEVVGEAKDGAEAVAATVAEIPDVVLMDIRMPGMDGLQATRLITAHPRLQGTKVIVLTTFDLDEYVFGALKAGASAFLLKGVEPPALIDAVRTVAGGEALLEPSATRRLIEAYVGGQQAASPPGYALPSSLTAREVEILRLNRRRPDQYRDRRTAVHQPADLQVARVADPDEAGRQRPHPARRARLRERPDRSREIQWPSRGTPTALANRVRNRRICTRRGPEASQARAARNRQGPRVGVPVSRSVISPGLHRRAHRRR